MGRHKSISDEQVIQAAREVFLRDGTAASTREIGKQAGLSQAALFQRFGDKAALFARAMVPEALDPGTVIGPQDELREVGTELHLENLAVRLAGQIGEVLPILLMIGQHPALHHDVVEQAHQRLAVPALVAALETHVAELGLQRPKEPADLVNALLLAAHGAALMQMAASPQAAGQAEDVLRRTVRSLVEGGV